MTIQSVLRSASLLVLAASAVAVAVAEESPIDRGVDRPVSNFQLRDVLHDRQVALADFAGKKVAVLVFTGTDCPVGNLYMPRLVELNAAYKDKGVVFLAINANAHEPAEDVAEHARSFGLDFPVLKDPGNAVADLFQAERTCEVLVIDGRGRLRYRGAIDDQYGLGTRREAPAKDFLVEALDAVLAGRPVPREQRPSLGCGIKWTDAAA